MNENKEIAENQNTGSRFNILGKEDNSSKDEQVMEAQEKGVLEGRIKDPSAWSNIFGSQKVGKAGLNRPMKTQVMLLGKTPQSAKGGRDHNTAPF